MSKSGALYMKGIDLSESEDDEDLDDDVWDDRKLNDAYDKALKIANAEVARRIAMSTNSPGKSNQGDFTNVKDKQSIGKHSKKDAKWKVGMPCRTIYEQDGIEYEAIVQAILKGQKCMVKFIGYDNSEVVPLASLRPSLGLEVQKIQVEQAAQDKADDDEYVTHTDQDNMDIGSSKGGKSPTAENVADVDRASPTSNTDRSSHRGPKFPKKKKKKNQKQAQMNGFNLPDMGMPNFAMLMNSVNDMPLPPPPPLGFPGRLTINSEEQAVSSMLLSWYMSGYYTGLYQGLKRARENGRNH